MGMVGNDEKENKKKVKKREREKMKKDGITSRWTRRLAFTVSEASVVANGERRISDWWIEGGRAGREACGYRARSVNLNRKYKK